MLKKIDIYILKKFLGTFVFSILLISIIIVIFDISEKIENFVNASIQEIIFDHYINFIPFIVNFLSPLFTFISVIFFTSRLAARYETVAILSAGVSYNRFLRPYIIGSILICILSLFLGHYVIPNGNRKMQEFEDRYINNHYQNNDQNIHRQVEKGTYVYLEHYYNQSKTGSRFTLEKVKNNRQYYILSAESVAWDSIKQLWRVNNYYEKFISEDTSLNSENRFSEKLLSGTVKEIKIDFSPYDLSRIESKVSVMTRPQLLKYIQKEREKGSSGIERFEVENYRRTAVPFSAIILTIIGVAISSRKIRGGIGMHLAMGLLLAASYMLFIQFSSIFAINGMLHPMIAVWIPNVIYSLIAYYLVKTAQK